MSSSGVVERLRADLGELNETRPDGTPYEIEPSRPWTGPTTRGGGDPPDTS